MNKDLPKPTQTNIVHNDDTLHGEIINEKYRLKKAIAKGGMGVIYVAEQLNLNREVAIKLIIQETDEQAEQRFLQEASLLQRSITRMLFVCMILEKMKKIACFLSWNCCKATPSKNTFNSKALFLCQNWSIWEFNYQKP